MKYCRSLLLVVLFLIPFSINAQSVLYCLNDGQYLPVAEVNRGIPLCFTGDDLIRGSAKKLTLLPSDSFAEGFLKIDIRKNERAGVTKSGGVLMFNSSQNWYTLICDVTSDADLSDCYFALGFDTYGKKSFYCRSLGPLKAGKKKTLRVYVKLGYEMPDNLHFFSGMEEIRTSLVPINYSYEDGHFELASNF